MGLMSFKDYRAAHNESSPSTRNKMAAFFGLQPMYSADVFGHATPIPAVAEKLLQKLKDAKGKKDKDDDDSPKKKGHYKKHKKDKKEKKDESVLSENKPKQPDRSFDHFIKKAEKAAGEVSDEQDKSHKEEERLSKEIEKLSKKKDSKPKTIKKDEGGEDNDVVASLKKWDGKPTKAEELAKPKKTDGSHKETPSKDEGFTVEESQDWEKIFTTSFDKTTPEY